MITPHSFHGSLIKLQCYCDVNICMEVFKTITAQMPFTTVHKSQIEIPLGERDVNPDPKGRKTVYQTTDCELQTRNYKRQTLQLKCTSPQ